MTETDEQMETNGDLPIVLDGVKGALIGHYGRSTEANETTVSVGSGPSNMGGHLLAQVASPLPQPHFALSTQESSYIGVVLT